MKHLIAILILESIFLAAVLDYCYGFPRWYIQEAWRDYQWSKEPHVVETRFYAEGELFCVRAGEANIQIGRDWLLTRESRWSDGYLCVEYDPQWVGRTWGVAIR